MAKQTLDSFLYRSVLGAIILLALRSLCSSWRTPGVSEQAPNTLLADEITRYSGYTKVYMYRRAFEKIRCSSVKGVLRDPSKVSFVM